MPALLWLPSVLRAAGLTVHEVDGWRTRTSRSYRVDQMQARNIVCHATAGSRRATDAGEIAVLLNGSSTAAAPIAQLYLGKQGHWWVVAAGVCNHIGSANVGGYKGNRYAIGIEASNNNSNEPWPDVQYRSYVIGVAAICRHLGWDQRHVYGHKEVSSTGKTDPTFDMTRFRAAVAAALGEPDREDDDVDLQQMVPTGVPGVWIKMQDWLAGMYYSQSQTRDTVVTSQADVAGLRAEVAGLTELVRAGGGDADTAALLAAIRAAGDRTRDEVLAALRAAEQAQANALQTATDGPDAG